MIAEDPNLAPAVASPEPQEEGHDGHGSDEEEVRDRRPERHPALTRRYRRALILGLSLGVLHIATRDGGASEAAAGIAEAPPTPPRVVSLEGPALDALASPSPRPVLAEGGASGGWTIPAEALEVAAAVREGDQLVRTLDDGTRVTLTLDPNLQQTAVEVLARHKVERGAIVAIRPSTGEILALADHAEGRPDLTGLTLSSEPPAASVFKVISAAALLEHAKLSPGLSTCVHGGNNSVDLYHLKPNPKLDTRCETLAEALGSSNNVVFGRLADQHLKPAQLQETVDRFMFNAAIPFHRQVGVSAARVPNGNRVGLARTSAGFANSTLSPLHAAMLTAAIGNRGVMMVPHLVRSASRGDAVLHTATPTALREVLKPDVAKTLLGMLEATMTTGTGRKYFQGKKGPRLGSVRAGGKSGSLSGETTEGKRHFSWFVAVAPVDGTNGVADLAVAALVVQGEQWTVKGAVLARDVMTAGVTGGAAGKPVIGR
jgi:peptidoglycan glycosyltransferase